MKNILWIFSVSVVFTLSSCISTAQFNNAEDDVYYSPKASNRKQPVMIPEVNVDEIIKKNPPQYGQPTNRVDDVTPNPNAAEGYLAYRAQQDTLYQQNPRISGYYIDPNLPNSETDEAERRNNRWFRRSYMQNNWDNWNYGLGWNSFYGPGISIGYNTFGFNNFGYNNLWGNNIWGNNWGFNYGYPYNSWGCSPFYNNWNAYCGWNPGFGFGNPYFNNFWGYPGYGGFNNPIYYYDNNNTGRGNAGNQPISKPRPNMGGTTPPTNNDGQNSGGRGYVAPQQSIDQPQPGANPNNGRAGSPANNLPANEQRLENVNGRAVYTRPAGTTQPAQTQDPATTPPVYQRAPAPANYTPQNAQRLENVNGRIIYKRPQESTQPVPTQTTPTPTYPAPTNQRASQPNQTRPTYNDSRNSNPVPQMNPSGGRSGGSSGAGRSGSSGGSSGGNTGGRRR